MSLPQRMRHLALAICVGLAIAVVGRPADAVEAPPGSKNFTPPSDVPNYFSNESGPFQGGANARNDQPGAIPVVAAPASLGGRAVASRRTSRRHPPAHVAKAGGRTRLAHGRASGHPQVAHAGAHQQVAHAGAARHGHASGPRVAHAPVTHLAGKTVAAKSRAESSKNKHPARAHG